MTVPESAAAVFERVLGEHRGGFTTGPYMADDGWRCACGVIVLADLGAVHVALVAWEAHVAAQLATALAQPDTLGDGDGVGERVAAAIESACCHFVFYKNQPGACGYCESAADVARALLDDQPSATSERGGRDG